MRIKKYKAVNLKVGKERVLEELGDDAIILSTRTIKASNPNQKDYIEIVAAVDDKPLQKNGTTPILDSIAKNFPKEKNEESSNPEVFMAIQKLQDDMNVLKYNMQTILDSFKYKYSNKLEGHLERIYKYLREEGFSEEFSYKTIGQISTKGNLNDFEKLIQKTKENISKELLFLKPLEPGKKQKIAFFMGPTGSGKTSSLVKLAIVNKILNNADILIISTDTDKVGGAEQLQSIATVAGIPYLTAYNSKDLQKIIEKEKDRKLIFIDTTGRSHKNNEHFKELNEYIFTSKPHIKYLVLSASTDVNTFTETIEKYEKADVSGLIITKFDETAKIGSIAESLRTIDTPMAYFANGQEIPDDIEPAGKEFITNYLFKNIEL